jgi:hypothetical protein
VDQSKQILRELFSSLDFSCLCCFLQRNNEKFRSMVRAVHERKLNTLGAQLQLSSCRPDKVIFNYSDTSLTQREQFLLAFGLDFNLPVYKLSFYRYFLNFENLFRSL